MGEKRILLFLVLRWDIDFAISDVGGFSICFLDGR
jgi:hypothetical protein